MIPVVRAFVSLPAGIAQACRWALHRLLADRHGALGRRLALAGEALGSDWKSVRKAFEWVDYVVSLLVMVGIVYVVVRRRRERRRPADRCGGLSAPLPLRQAVALGLLQGPTELLPVSSSAHTALLPWLAGWSYGELDDELRKGFEVALHGRHGGRSGTAGRPRARRRHDHDAADTPRRAAAGAPTPALAGLVLGRRIERGLGEPLWIALALAGGSAAMVAAELRGQRAGGGRGFDEAGNADGLALGLAQAVALIPGVSRSGASIGGRALAGVRPRGCPPAVVDGGAAGDRGRLAAAGAAPPAGGSGGIAAASMAAGAGPPSLSTLAAGSLLRTRLRDCPPVPFALYRGALAGWVVLRANARR